MWEDCTDTACSRSESEGAKARAICSGKMTSVIPNACLATMLHYGEPSGNGTNSTILLRAPRSVMAPNRKHGYRKS